MEILIILLLIILNGFFALSEISLVSSKKSRLEQMAKNGNNGASVALKLLQKSESFLSAIQVGITLIGIVTGVYGGVKIAEKVTPLFEGIDFTANYASEASMILTVFVITYISIVVGELVPKTIGLSNPEKISTKIAPPIFYFSKAFYPFVKLLSFSTRFINKLLGIGVRDERITEAELRQLLKTASTMGVIEKEQNIIHEKAFYFSDKKARHIMTPANETQWVDLDRPLEEVREKLWESTHSKVICCRGNINNLEGILNMRDYFRLASAGKPEPEEMILKPVIVSPGTISHEVLRQLRENQVHICCVVNKKNQLEGIITLHDIMENLVGTIPEEGEAYEPDVFIREDRSMLINADAPIETLAQLIEGFPLDFESINYADVEGFVISQIKKTPETGDEFTYLGHRFEVMDVDGTRIDKVLITKIPASSEK